MTVLFILAAAAVAGEGAAQGGPTTQTMTRVHALSDRIARISENIDLYIAALRGLETSKPGSAAGQGGAGRTYRDQLAHWERRLRDLTAQIAVHQQDLNAVRRKFAGFRANRMSGEEINALTAALRAEQSERNKLDQVIVQLNGLFRDLAAMQRAAPG